MVEFGLLHLFLGIQVLKMDDGNFISQPKYVSNHLQKFRMEDYKPCATPYQSKLKLTKESDSLNVDTTLYQQLVSSLIYLTHIQLNISFLVSVFSWFIQYL